MSALLRQMPMSEWRPTDELAEMHFEDGRVLAQCTDVPAGHAAGCEHLLAERVESFVDCAKLVTLVDGGDTVNFADDICQVQRCKGEDASLDSDRPAMRYTTMFRGMKVYSFLCSAVGYADALNAVYPDDIGKEQDYWTTSVVFKKDLRLFFQRIGQEWTVLELGAYRGYTTRVLSEVFGQVIAVDTSDVFLGHNRRHNADRRNILYAAIHTRLDGLRSLRHNSVHVVLVDAEHDYESVRRDAREALRLFGPDLRFLVFDDYATDDGVRRAVDELVAEGSLAMAGGLGYRPPWSYHGTVVHGWEGVVCEVLGAGAAAAAARGPSPERIYAWVEESLWHAEDSLQFQRGGLVASSRGPGRWRRAANFSQGLWLDWPSQRPPALGGPPGAEAVEETWFLQFGADFDKFAAAFAGAPSRSAAGWAGEVLETMVRRLFVSVNHEFCNTANECELREAAGRR